MNELNPISWSKSNLWGFTMFSKEIKIAAVSAYLSGMPQSQIRRKYHIKGSATLYNWVHLIQTLGLEGVKNQQRHKTNYSYTFIIKVISWRLEKQASLPMTAKRFHIRHPAQIWQWEQALKAGRLKPDKQRRTGNMTKQDDDKIKALEAENELLRIKVAYLEKLEALAQEKKKLQTKTKRL